MKKLGLPASIRIMSGAVIEFLPQINVNYATLVRAHTGGLIAALSQATPGSGRRNQIQRNIFDKIKENTLDRFSEMQSREPEIDN